MKTKILGSIASTALCFLSAIAVAQQLEAVHGVKYTGTNQAKAALDALMQDDAMEGARVTLYALDFGEAPAPYLVVEDFEDYSDYQTSTENRIASHGWSRYQLAAHDADYLGSTLVMVVDDHGAPRHTAGYLAAFLINTTDAATYRSAMADLDDAIDNPGVLRLVALRTGSMAGTHAVLIGGDDFESVNEYLDMLFASDAFGEFVEKVGDTRKVVAVDMYRRVATWGD